jgi:small neutral amino acid transporter SnatA (MarC family)
VAELLSNAFITLLAVLDPLGTAPLFVGLSWGRSEAYKREAAREGTASR